MLGLTADYDCCDECASAGAVAELRRVIARLEVVHTAVEAHLAANHPDPALVTDATTGRYVLLDSLVTLVTARTALAQANR